MRTSPSELLIDLGYFSSSLVSIHTSFPRVIHPPRVFLGSPKRPRARHVRSLYTARVAPEKLPGREFMVISSQKNPGYWAHECLSRCQAAPPKNRRAPVHRPTQGWGSRPSASFSLPAPSSPSSHRMLPILLSVLTPFFLSTFFPHTSRKSNGGAHEPRDSPPQLTPQFLRHQRTSHTSLNARIPRGWESLPMPAPMGSSRDSA